MNNLKKFFVLELPEKIKRCANSVYFVKSTSSTFEIYVTDKNKNAFEFETIRDISDLTDNDNLLTEGDKNYVYKQITLSKEWLIKNHGLNKFPSVTIFDEGGEEVIGEKEYIDENNMKISFGLPIAGVAYLN